MSKLGSTTARAALRQRWYDEGFYGDQSLYDALAAGAQRFGDVPVIFETTNGRRTLTLRESLVQAATVAGGLSELGVRSGDIVAVQLPNWPEALVCYLAAARLNATILPIVHIYGPTETEFIVRESGAKVLVIPDTWGTIDYVARVEAMSYPDTLSAIVVVGEQVPSWGTPFAAVRHGNPAPIAPLDSADSRCVLLYTSGTTAEPKGVQHSHNSFLTELRTTPTPPRHVADTVNFQPFPAGHIAGLTALLGPFVHGFTTIVMDKWDADHAVAVIREFGVTAAAGTPFHHAGLLACSSPTHELPLRDLVTGGAGVPPSIVTQADVRGWRIARCYGSSEQPTVTSSLSDDSVDERAYTDGRPLSGNAVRIADDGEVLVIGPDQFLGYTDPALDADAFTADGWFRTGDLGTFVDGRLTITDRKKDVIIRGGENISSSEVEAILVTHPAVADAAVVGYGDDRYGERVGAFIVLAPNATLDLAEVQAHFAAAGVARQKTPERLEMVSELPRTPAGKVKKHELLAGMA